LTAIWKGQVLRRTTCGLSQYLRVCSTARRGRSRVTPTARQRTSQATLRNSTTDRGIDATVQARPGRGRAVRNWLRGHVQEGSQGRRHQDHPIEKTPLAPWKQRLCPLVLLQSRSQKRRRHLGGIPWHWPPAPCVAQGHHVTAAVTSRILERRLLHPRAPMQPPKPASVERQRRRPNLTEC
jgi:hypothetical protein